MVKIVIASSDIKVPRSSVVMELSVEGLVRG
jgi:hypothetical protein